ncbi:MAG: hypothetical protein LBQ58_11000 [Synergistaceae bacterium]|nr:hypothetical protein [Synergistaceae bacterium]
MNKKILDSKNKWVNLPNVFIVAFVIMLILPRTGLFNGPNMSTDLTRARELSLFLEYNAFIVEEYIKKYNALPPLDETLYNEWKNSDIQWENFREFFFAVMMQWMILETG